VSVSNKRRDTYFNKTEHLIKNCGVPEDEIEMQPKEEDGHFFKRLPKQELETTWYQTCLVDNYSEKNAFIINKISPEE
jgi:hypothetical protein